MTRVRILAGALSLFLLPAIVLAGGFQLNEHGASAMAQAGAFAARASDLSAIYFNPAGLAQLAGFHASIGGTGIMPTSSFESSTIPSVDMVKQTFVIPNVYASYALDNGLVVGAGFYTPFGLGTEWPVDWAGRYYAVKADLHSYNLNPTIAYKVSDMLMVGAGFSYMWSNVKISYFVSPLVPTGEATLDAKGNAWSANAGAIFKPTPDLSIGASYRHSTKTDLKGTAVFMNMGPLTSFFPGGDGSTTIDFPNQIFAGVSYKLTQNLTLEFDYQWIGWSSYDTLVIQLPNGPAYPLTQQPLQTTTKAAKNWKDASMLRLGGEYRYNEWAFRLGVLTDFTPQPARYVEPLLPDADRVEVTGGIGYEFMDHFTVDVAYQLIIFKDRTVTGPTNGDLNTFPGRYKNQANLGAVSLSYTM
jgi:long-chain fatty acid transport protein